ncbi:MAG: PEP/pyruvate-binding domain-containing protein, partial [Thermoguttaceae bacterium]
MNVAEQTPGCDLPHIRFFGLDSDAGDLPGLAEVGGKAVNLCKLTRAKLPVPPGFVVTTQAYLGFIGEDGLGARIAALAAKIEDGDAAMVETVSAQIRALLTGCPMHKSLDEEILQAYRRLRVAGGERIAVRSSATAEDLPEASFAGQQDTYLNVRGEESLLKAVQSCWASLWTARAVAYRAKQKTPAEGLAMAVVVQQMVMADAAGVLFTANPVTGARDEVVINAAWGLGEAVVGGEVTPDRMVVEKASGRIKELTVSEKAVMTAITEDGTRQVALSDDRRLARVLGDDEVARLVAIGRQIECFYDAPQDIEWAIVAGQFAVLQSRSIRGLEVASDVEAGRVTEIERLSAISGSRRRIWVVHNLGETLAAPTPLTWDIIRRFMSGEGGFGRFYHDLGYRPSPQVCKEGFLELIGHRIYADPERLA